MVMGQISCRSQQRAGFCCERWCVESRRIRLATDSAQIGVSCGYIKLVTWAIRWRNGFESELAGDILGSGHAKAAESHANLNL